MPRDASMKAHAVTFALLMIASSLAGCTTAGTDGVPEVTLDDEDIETFLDDYFQDFVNNSSVVINQEIHYHNETTVHEGDDSSVRHYNGSSHQSTIIIKLEYTPSDFIDLPDYDARKNATFTRQDGIVIDCRNYHLDWDTINLANDSNYFSSTNESYWSSGNQGEYHQYWYYHLPEYLSDALRYSAGDTITRNTCDPDYDDNSLNLPEFFDLGTITVPQGYGMICSEEPVMYRVVNDYQQSFGVYMHFDEIHIDCGIPYGDEEHSTTISFSVRSYQLDLQHSDGYSFYFAYQLAEVTNGELA